MREDEGVKILVKSFINKMDRVQMRAHIEMRAHVRLRGVTLTIAVEDKIHGLCKICITIDGWD